MHKSSRDAYNRLYSQVIEELGYTPKPLPRTLIISMSLAKAHHDTCSKLIDAYTELQNGGLCPLVHEAYTLTLNSCLNTLERVDANEVERLRSSMQPIPPAVETENKTHALERQARMLRRWI